MQLCRPQLESLQKLAHWLVPFQNQCQWMMMMMMMMMIWMKMLGIALNLVTGVFKWGMGMIGWGENLRNWMKLNFRTDQSKAGKKIFMRDRKEENRWRLRPPNCFPSWVMARLRPTAERNWVVLMFFCKSDNHLLFMMFCFPAGAGSSWTDGFQTCPADFHEDACQHCKCVHKRFVHAAGVDEPLQEKTKETNKTTSDEHKLFRAAMNKEWQSFLDPKAVKIIPAHQARDIPRDRILRIRFTLTNKNDTGKALLCKARMVCGGHLDPDISLLRTDAPTADTMGVNLVFLLASSYQWVLLGGDIPTAFLSRVFDHRAPQEGLLGVKDGEVIEMQKGVWGLCNAPRLWWRRLRRVLTEVGFEEMEMMQCVFVYWARDVQGNKRCSCGWSCHRWWLHPWTDFGEAHREINVRKMVCSWVWLFGATCEIRKRLFDRNCTTQLPLRKMLR